MTATLEDVHRADDIAVYVGVRVLDRVAHAGLGGQVDDLVETLVGEQLVNSRLICQVDSPHVERVIPREDVRPRLFEADVVIIIEIIEPDDRIAAIEQTLRRVKADETGSPGDEDLHRPTERLQPAVRGIGR